MFSTKYGHEASGVRCLYEADELFSYWNGESGEILNVHSSLLPNNMQCCTGDAGKVR